MTKFEIWNFTILLATFELPRSMHNVFGSEYYVCVFFSGAMSFEVCTSIWSHVNENKKKNEKKKKKKMKKSKM